MARKDLKQQLAHNAARRQARLEETDTPLPPVPSSPGDNDPAARQVPLSQVRANPLNARQIDLSDPEQNAALEVLALSIQTHGILQPPLVRTLPTGDYEIIAGDRRFLAAQKAGLEMIPVRIRQAEASVLLQINMVENLVRAELSPADMGRGFAELKRALQAEHNRQRNANVNTDPNANTDANVNPKNKPSRKQTAAKLIEKANATPEANITLEANATPGSHSMASQVLTWHDVATITGLTPRSMQRYMAIANLIDELEELDLPATEKALVRNLTEKQLRPALALEAGPQRTEFVREIARENLSSRQAEARAKSLRSQSARAKSPQTTTAAPNAESSAAARLANIKTGEAEPQEAEPQSDATTQGMEASTEVEQIEQALLAAIGHVEDAAQRLASHHYSASQYQRKVQPHLQSLHSVLQSLENLKPDKKQRPHAKAAS